MKKNEFSTQEFFKHMSITQIQFEGLRKYFIKSKGIQKLTYYDVNKDNVAKIVVFNSDIDGFEKAEYLITKRVDQKIKHKKYLIELCTYTRYYKNNAIKLEYFKTHFAQININSKEKLECEVTCYLENDTEIKYKLSNLNYEDAICWVKNAVITIVDVCKDLDTSVLTVTIQQLQKSDKLNCDEFSNRKFQVIGRKIESQMEKQLLNILEKRPIGAGWYTYYGFKEAQYFKYVMMKSNKLSNDNVMQKIVYNVSTKGNFDNQFYFNIKFAGYIKYEKESATKNTYRYFVNCYWNQSEKKYYMCLKFENLENMYICVPIDDIHEDDIIQVVRENYKKLTHDKYSSIEKILEEISSKINVEDTTKIKKK